MPAITATIGYVSINQFKGPVGHVDVTIWGVDGQKLGTFGRNQKTGEGKLEGGWYPEDEKYYDMAGRVNKQDFRMSVDAAHGAAIADFLNTQVAGGPGTDGYLLLPGQVCADGVNEIIVIGGLPGDVFDYMHPDASAVYAYALLQHGYRMDEIRGSGGHFYHMDYRPTDDFLGHLSPSWAPVKLRKGWGEVVNAPLGSRLIHSQNATRVARATAERKLAASLS